MRRFCFALALSLTLVLPAHAPAWDGAQTVIKSRLGPFVVVGNEHGRRLVAWAHGGGVFARVAPRGGRFGPRLRIAAPGAKLAVQAAMDERGDTVLVWPHFIAADPDYDREADDDGRTVCCTRLEAAVLRRDGRLTRSVQVGVPDAINGGSLLSTDGRGRIAMAWEIEDETSNDIAVYARFGTMRHGFGRLRLMSPPGESGIPMSVARGRVVYATQLQTVETSLRAGGRLARRVLLDFPIASGQLGADDRGRQTGAWGNGETVTRTPPGPFQTVAQHDTGRVPLVRVAGSSAAAVAWLPGGLTPPATRLMAAVRAPDASFGSPVELDRVEADEVTLSSVDVAPDGSAAVAAVFWHRQEPDPLLSPRVYLVPADGGAAERLTLPRADSTGAQVLRDARGTLAVVTKDRGVVARWMR